MKTKLVYIVTYPPEGYYLEQAVLATYSARYHNPSSHIVLVVDDKTDELINNGRGEILGFINERIVVPFDGDETMMYRSRWIKTSVRELITGDFLYIDCDTLVCKELSEIDSYKCNMGAVWESHLPVKDFCDDLMKAATKANWQIGVDLDEENEYFSSGVLYVRDTPEAHQLYILWHRFWLDSYRIGVSIDQPSLAKANRESGHIIKRIPDTFNCILFTQNNFTAQAHILHIASFRNPSFLFTRRVFELVREEGLPSWIRDCILHPCDSFLPFDYSVRHSSLKDRLIWIKAIAATSKTISKNLPNMLNSFPMRSSARELVLWLFNHNCYYLGATVWMAWKRLQVLRKKGLKDNVCRK